MNGISSKAAGGIQNRNKFNSGNELQSQEFSDGSGLETYDAKHRMYDLQIGKFLQIDPLSDIAYEFSPYAFSNNNPISLNDPWGLSATTPGVNSENENDNARMLDVVVSNKPKSTGWNGFGWPASTSSERNQWKDNQNLYYNRKSAGQDVVQIGDPSSYTSSVGMYKRWDAAEQDYRKMSIGAVSIISAPVVAVALVETGAGAALGQGLKYVLKPRLGINPTGALADFTVQTIQNKGRFWENNLYSTAGNLFFNNPLYSGLITTASDPAQNSSGNFMFNLGVNTGANALGNIPGLMLSRYGVQTRVFTGGALEFRANFTANVMAMGAARTQTSANDH